MEKLDLKNINKSVISAVNNAMQFKIDAILNDYNSDFEDSYNMCHSVNNQAIIYIENLIQDLLDKKELYKVYFAEYIEEPTVAHDNLIIKTLKSNTENFIFKKENEIFKMIKEQVRKKEEEEIERHKFKKIRI